MDGVLVNFHKGALSFFGVNPQTHNREFTQMWEDPKMQTRIKKEWPTFWMDLHPLAHTHDLWRIISPHHPAILTAIPPWWPSAATGKRVWLRRHLPKFGYHPHETFHAVMRQDKQKYATQSDGTPNILIDDHSKNIREWESAGGIGVLYTDTPASLRTVAQTIAKHF